MKKIHIKIMLILYLLHFLRYKRSNQSSGLFFSSFSIFCRLWFSSIHNRSIVFLKKRNIVWKPIYIFWMNWKSLLIHFAFDLLQLYPYISSKTLFDVANLISSLVVTRTEHVPHLVISWFHHLHIYDLFLPLSPPKKQFH